jgi:hypothetical protein
MSLLLRWRSNRDRRRTNDPALAGERLRAATSRSAPSLPARPFTRGRRSLCGFAQGDERHHRSRPNARQLGAGLDYVLFEEPDGIRLEVNFVPGAGLLAEGAQFNPRTGYIGGTRDVAVPRLSPHLRA